MITSPLSEIEWNRRDISRILDAILTLVCVYILDEKNIVCMKNKSKYITADTWLSCIWSCLRDISSRFIVIDCLLCDISWNWLIGWVSAVPRRSKSSMS